jgi:hypothetical protein
VREEPVEDEREEPAAGGQMTKAAVAGLIGVIVGALLGALITGWFSLTVQERLLEHEDRTRFHQERRHAYAAYLDAIREVDVEFETYGGTYVESLDRAGQLLAELELIAPDDVYELAVELFGHSQRAFQGEHEYDALEAKELRVRFVRAARKELGRATTEE